MALNLRKHPILSSLLDRGVIHIDENEYIGVTPKGEEINLGTYGFEDTLEAYLKGYPDPSNW